MLKMEVTMPILLIGGVDLILHFQVQVFTVYKYRKKNYTTYVTQRQIKIIGYDSLHNIASINNKRWGGSNVVFLFVIWKEICKEQQST